MEKKLENLTGRTANVLPSMLGFTHDYERHEQRNREADAPQRQHPHVLGGRTTQLHL